MGLTAEGDILAALGIGDVLPYFRIFQQGKRDGMFD
jgi:hypothetical protein